MKNRNFTIRFLILLLFAFPLTKAVAQQPVSTLPNNIVYVDAVGDFPREQMGAITLNPFKVYIISGMVDIGQSYIIMNGAGLRGLDPTKDRILSATKGAVLRSQDTDVYLEKLCIVPLGPTTSAYDFEDNTGTKTLNLLSGNSVIEIGRAHV